MKTILSISMLMILSNSLNAQEIAFIHKDSMSNHLVSLHTGIKYTTGYGLGYGYRWKGKFPLLIGAEISTPYGGKIMDDFKAGLNLQTIFYSGQHFGISIKPAMSFSRYGADLAVVLNISAGVQATLGYYRKKWCVAAEAGFESNQATMIKNRALREDYPEIEDGWYAVRGGYFNFGLVASYWFKSTGFAVKAGVITDDHFSDQPTIPYYFDFSIQRRL